MTDIERLDWLEKMLEDHTMRMRLVRNGIHIRVIGIAEPFSFDANGVDFRTAIDNAAHVLKP